MNRISTTYPHLARSWREAVMLELRLRGVDGEQIGDALAVAEAHCADSGESARESFGSPQEYASTLFLPNAQPRSTRAAVIGALPALPGLAGMMLALATTASALRSEATAISWGSVLATFLIAAVAVVLVRRGDVFLRHAWVGGTAMAVAIGGFVGLTVAVTSVAVVLPTGVAALTAGLLLAAGVVWARVSRPAVDPVRDPLKGDPSPRTTRLLTAAYPWFFVAMTAFGVALTTIIGA